VLTAIKAPQHANLDYVERFSYKLDTIYKISPKRRRAGSSTAAKARHRASAAST